MHLIKVRLTRDNNLDTSENEKSCNEGKPFHRLFQKEFQEQPFPKRARALRSAHFSSFTLSEAVESIPEENKQ